MTSTQRSAPLPVSENHYLAGNFGPVAQEVTAYDLPVTGSIPDYLDGRFLRIGPNPIDPNPETYQWFLGEGMVHGLRIGDSRAQWYRNRWVRSARVARALGEEWRGGPWRGGFDFAANTNIIGHAGRTLALTETGARPYELDDELDTVGPSDFCGSLRGGYTAHPKRDPVSGELHAVSYNPLRANLARYSVTGVDGRIRREVDIPLRGSVMIHDFALTENYVLIYDLPVVLDLGNKLLNRFFSTHSTPSPLAAAAMSLSHRVQPKNLQLPYRWDPSYGARIGVLPRERTAAKVRWFEIEPCFVYHTLNAYEEGQRIVIDAVRHPSTFVNGHNEPTIGVPALHRWTADLATGRITEAPLDDRRQEFPRVDERLIGRRHRFGYSVARLNVPDTRSADTLLRNDVTTGTTEVVSFDGDGEPGEFIHVPSGPGTPEDDGVVMGFVYRHETGRSDLVILDAGTLDHVATVHLPARVPNGFHGNWVPTA
ncbi:carotenoid oxygenase family protein [Nocardia stercoris]|uniref:Dioxygenase n=1 Tax=Nocardia stercoris TaxID=2483361 RepID=A0A3M2L761_9NOCA|nr:carotenoid oxygenase family protein [Nocardia stercoris]RMI33481.1 carotenoid oxygenase [Nocardia stercoris]